jgi:hypothetical protein
VRPGRSLDAGGDREGLPGPGDAQAERRRRATGSVDDADEAHVSDDLMRIVRDGVPNTEDRSLAFFDVVEKLKWAGSTAAGVYKLLARYPDGIGRKYAQDGRDRLEQEVKRAFDKVAAPQLGAPPPSPPPPQSGPSVWSSSPLEDTHRAFAYWLGKDHRVDVLDATLAAAATDRLGGDPLWLMVISGSGDAKTETVQSLSGAGALVTSTITSEGALLSATTRSAGATGGLLVKMGRRGLLTIKDFTSIISSDRNIRGAVLAALREIYDGRWERNVGFAGGRTLTWSGRITVVAACTTPGTRHAMSCRPWVTAS